LAAEAVAGLAAAAVAAVAAGADARAFRFVCSAVGL
jgi:hypothetical protein